MVLVHEQLSGEQSVVGEVGIVWFLIYFEFLVVAW